MTKMVRWIHVSDLHLGNDDAVDTILMRKMLPEYIRGLGKEFDYMFCTGDIKEWNSDYSTAIDYFRELCIASHIDLENLFIVPGNHDIDTNIEGREELINRLKDWNSDYYKSNSGIISIDDYSLLRQGEIAFIQFISDLLGKERAGKYKSPHFTITTKDFNIIHVDTAMTYGRKSDSNFIIGTRLFMDAIEQCDNSKPTFILSHYSFNFLEQDERNKVAFLLKNHIVAFWLAGHEHSNLITPQRNLFFECQSGNVTTQKGSNACFLTGEFDPVSGVGSIIVHVWFENNGWGIYPFAFIGSGDIKEFKFHINKQGKATIYEMNTDLAEEQLARLDEKEEHEALCSEDSNYKKVKTKGVDSNDSIQVPCLLSLIPAPVDLIGRDEIINTILREFDSKNIIELKAPGGTGKTAIAAHICNRLRIQNGNSHTPSYIAWITSSGDLQKDLLKLDIPLATQTADDAERTRRYITWLSNPDNDTLLVIDNVELPLSVREKTILNTISGTTKILITTRVKNIDIPSIRIEPLNIEHSILLFIKYYTELDSEKTGKWEDNNIEELNIIKDIVKETGGNALLIELIAKTASAENVSLNTFWYDLHEKKVFSRDSNVVIENMHAESHGLDEEKDNLTLLEQVRKLYSVSNLSEPQQKIMNFFSGFSADTVIRKEIMGWAGFAQKDILCLLKKSWIYRNEESYYIHPIVKRSIQLQMEKNGIKIDNSIYNKLIQKLISNDSFISETLDYITARERLFFIQELGEIIWENGVEIDDLVALYREIGIKSRKQGDYYSSVINYQRALKTQKKEKGENCVEVGCMLSELALSYCLMGSTEEAINNCEAALKVLQSTTHINSLVMVNAYNTLGFIYDYLGEHSKALESYEVALCLLQISGQYDESIASTIQSNMAHIYSVTGGNDEALLICRNDLEHSLRKYGEDHPKTGTSYNNLALALSGVGEYEEAVDCLKKAIFISEKHLGKNHKETAGAYDNLALVLYEEGEYDEALKYVLSAVEIFRDCFGQNNLDTATAYYRLGLINARLGNYEEAMNSFNIAINVRKKILGNDDLTVANVEISIADLLVEQGELENAYFHYEQAFSIRKQKMDESDPDMISTCFGMGVLLCNLQRFDEANLHFRNVLSNLTKIYGDDSSIVQSVISNIQYLMGDHYIE